MTASPAAARGHESAGSVVASMRAPAAMAADPIVVRPRDPMRSYQRPARGAKIAIVTGCDQQDQPGNAGAEPLDHLKIDRGQQAGGEDPA